MSIKKIDDLKESDLDLRDSSGATLLHYAACYQDVNLLKIICKYLQGRKVLQVENSKQVFYLLSKTNEGYTPLMYAVLSNREISVKYLILKQNGIVNLTNSRGDTALHLALKNDFNQIAKYLIEKGTFKLKIISSVSIHRYSKS